jgi:N6-L-threonylcarbamoyladenine synthase
MFIALNKVFDKNKMTILGIETSCDDTGIAVIKAGEKKPVPAPEQVRCRVNFDILSNVVSSQIKTHAPFGGVVPNLAAREHLKNIEPCLREALRTINLKLKQIDLIAVTTGPGLIPSLLIGVSFAKALAYKYKIPIVGINHIEGHIIAALAATNPKSEARNPKQLFPAIALVVSGGHTQLVLVKNLGNYKIIGETRDDAAGECFDKVAKLLRLGYPGGPAISREAAKFHPTGDHPQGGKIQLPRPMINHKNYDFSFSGLKTAVLYLVMAQNSKLKTQDFIQELCHETQQAIIDVLISKTLRAAQEYKAKTIILSGGVAANEELRKQFSSRCKVHSPKLEFLTPSKILCTDNGAMIAMTGYYNKNKATKNYNRIKANANLRIS